MMQRWLWLWLLSGVPVGVGLILMPPWLRWWAFAFFISLDTGHTVAPIIAAWSHKGFRRTMDPARFVVLPILIVLACLAVGILTQAGWTSFDLYHRHQTWIVTDLSNPFPLLCWLYWGWNIYHFGMQNFGVARICRVGSDRVMQLTAAVGLTVFCMALLPLIDGSFYTTMLMTGAISVNHWVVELGLTQKIAARWWFLPVALGIGSLAFIWTVPTPTGSAVILISGVSARMGLGFVHFLYDRWIYKFSNPAVRSTIGLAF